jgi:hypothetical protein
MDANNNNPNNNPSNNPNPNNLTVRYANSLEEAIEASRLAEEEALKTGRSSVTFVNYEMSQERVTALMNRLASRAGLLNGPEAAAGVRGIMNNAMVGQFGDAGSDNEGNSSEEEREYNNRTGGNGGRGNGGGRGGRGNVGGGRGGRG